VTDEPRVPLRGSYPAAVSLALLALCPFLVVSAASALFHDVLIRELPASAFGLALASGLAEAGYAFGAVIAADVVQRLSTRRVFLVCELLFVAGSLLTLFAPGIVAFAIGRVVQGIVTGMLLVAALPPLVTNHGADKLPLTAAFISLGLFGVTTLGPLAGGIVGSTQTWRPLFAIVAALAAAGFVAGVLAFEPTAPRAPGMGFDSPGSRSPSRPPRCHSSGCPSSGADHSAHRPSPCRSASAWWHWPPWSPPSSSAASR
jgi:MFS family permease